MTYSQPKTRSLNMLDGTKIYAAPGSILDASKFIATAVPAGSRGRIVANGETLEEAGNPGVPVRFIGNNSGFTFTLNLDKTGMKVAMEKLRSQGMNFNRIHGIESYLIVDGPLGVPGAPDRIGNHNWSPLRYDEFDYYVWSMKQAGIYYSLNPKGENLSINLNGGDRYTQSTNTSGSATAVISGGQVVSITLVSGGSNHWFPPAVVINGDPATGGVGATAVATVNAATGVVTGYTVLTGGAGYTVAPAVSNYGGSFNAKLRIRCDKSMQDEWVAMMTILLTHVNPYTKLRLIDDPGLAFVECYNESHLAVLARSSVPSLLIPQFQLWLSNRYGTIATLNTKWGSSFTSFCDAGLTPKVLGFTPSTTIEKWLMNESMHWTTQSDIDLYKWYSSQLRAIGYVGIITTRDMGVSPVMPKTFNDSGSGIQTYHAYGALQDTYTTGQDLSSSGANANAPAAYGVNSIWSCLNNLMPGSPRFWTEAGNMMPNKYRGEIGILFGAYSSMYNFSGITLHGDAVLSNYWGATNTFTRGKGIGSSAYGHDPACIASVFLMSTMFHRRDVDVAAIDKTYVINDNALSYFSDPTLVASPPVSFYEQYSQNTPSMCIPMCARIETSIDPTNSSTLGTAWQVDILKSWSTLITEMGFPSNHEVYDWVVTRGNNSVLYGAAMGAVRYTRNRQIFADQLAGILGVNTARTQAGVCSKAAVQPNGSKIRNGSAGYVDKPGRDGTRIPGNSYKTNFMGNRFWQNLEINYIEDTVLLGITSSDNNPISSTSSIIIATSANSYNNGATWQPNDNTVVSIPVTSGGSAWTAPPLIRIIGNGVANGFFGVGVLTGSVLTSVLVQAGGTGYTNVTGVPITAGGSGYTNGTFPLTFTGGNGSGVTGTYTASGGVVVSTNVTNTGCNYDATLVASITGGGGTGATFGTPTLTAITVAAVRAPSDTTGGGAVFGPPVFAPDDENKEIELLAPWAPSDKGFVSVSITAAGSGYTDGTFPLTLAGGNGSGAAATYTSVGGKVVSTKITAAGQQYTTAGTASITGGGGTGATFGTPVLADREGWPILTSVHLVDFNIIGVDTTKSWILYELDYNGNRVASYPVRMLSNGVNVRIDSSKTLLPSVFFELVKGDVRYLKSR